jgi:CspA family cold shock protein
MALGTSKWFSLESGYGLISPDDGGMNLFVRSTDMTSSSLLEALEKGTKVAYEVYQGRNGTRAKNISKEQIRYSWRDSCLERHEGKEARHEYYEQLGEGEEA